MVDKVIVLGLIDVRDMEEVGVGPLMEELGLDEETAAEGRGPLRRGSQDRRRRAGGQEDRRCLRQGRRPPPRLAADKAALLALGDSPADTVAATTKMPDALEAVAGAARRRSPFMRNRHSSASMMSPSPEEQAIEWHHRNRPRRTRPRHWTRTKTTPPPSPRERDGASVGRSRQKL